MRNDYTTSSPALGLTSAPDKLAHAHTSIRKPPIVLRKLEEASTLIMARQEEASSRPRQGDLGTYGRSPCAYGMPVCQ